MNHGKDTVNDLPQFCGEYLKCSELEIVELEIDNILNFASLIKTLCSKAFQK